CVLLIFSLLPIRSALSQDLFESKIRPILATKCFACHSDSALGGLRLDSRDSLMRGGKSGVVIVPGDPENSLLIAAVRQTGELKMPMGGKLAADEVSALVEWVRAGAKWTDVDRGALKTPASGDVISAERRAFWSFQPLRPVQIPAVKDVTRAKTNIDRF